jgi:hypothetical protein
MKIFIKKYISNRIPINLQKRNIFEELLQPYKVFYFSTQKNNPDQKKTFYYKPKKKNKKLDENNYGEKENILNGKSSSQNSKIEDLSTDFLNELVSKLENILKY